MDRDYRLVRGPVNSRCHIRAASREPDATANLMGLQLRIFTPVELFAWREQMFVSTIILELAAPFAVCKFLHGPLINVENYYYSAHTYVRVRACVCAHARVPST